MKRICHAMLCMMALSACHRSFEPFTFVHMSDPQIGFIDDSPQYVHSDSLMKAAVDAANALDPAFVFVTGDLVNEPYNPVQDSIYKTRIAEVHAPVYEVPGNHDIRGFNAENHRHYLDWRGYDRFSFRERGCAFIGMDTNCIKDGAEEFEAAQQQWLREELAAARGCRYVFVFMHCPVIRETIDEPEDYFNFSREKRLEYFALFKEYGVTAVFAGHCHQEWEGEYDGIKVYTAGPVCNALGHGTPGYNVVRVSAEGLSVEYVPTPGIDPTHCRF